MSSIFMSVLTTWPIEPAVGYLLRNRRENDSGLFARHATISNTPQRITVTSPSCGESGCTLAKEYGASSIGGADKIPSISWSGDKDVQEWLLVVEDPDAPTAEPIVHGIYYGIPATKMSVSQKDFELEASEGSELVNKALKGGFLFGQNRRGNVYIPPRPISMHGPHRYFFQVVGLSQKLDAENMAKETGETGVSKEVMLKAIEGKVAARGEWVGVYDRK